MKVLHLRLLRKWYNEIESGKKTKEYRDITDYYTGILRGKGYDAVTFHCDKDTMTYKITKITTAKKIGKYIIHLGERVKE